MPSPALLLFLVLPTFGYGQKEKPELSEEIKEIIQHVHNECVGKTGVSEEDITNCENGVFKEDMKLKCYMFCLLEEGSLVDDEGNVDYDMMVSLIPEQYTNRVVNMIDGCKHLDTPDKDKCQRAYDVHKCSYSKDPKVLELIQKLNCDKFKHRISLSVKRPLPATQLPEFCNRKLVKAEIVIAFSFRSQPDSVFRIRR